MHDAAAECAASWPARSRLRRRGRTARRRREIARCARVLRRRRSGDVLIDDAGAGGDGVGCVRSGMSPSANGRGDATLGPDARRPAPSGAAASTVTGIGASFSAVNRPASPPPTMTTSPRHRASSAARKRSATSRSCVAMRPPTRLHGGRRMLRRRVQFVRLTMRSTARRALAAIADRRAPRSACRAARVDVLEADALHVRAQVARPDELDVRRFDGDVGRHRALGDQRHLARPLART